MSLLNWIMSSIFSPFLHIHYLQGKYFIDKNQHYHVIYKMVKFKIIMTYKYDKNQDRNVTYIWKEYLQYHESAHPLKNSERMSVSVKS